MSVAENNINVFLGTGLLRIIWKFCSNVFIILILRPRQRGQYLADIEVKKKESMEEHMLALKLLNSTKWL